MKTCSHKLIHTGGGTLFVGNNRHPCDDSYYCSSCKRHYEVTSTLKAHFSMPERTTLKSLKRRVGVGVLDVVWVRK